VWSGGCAYGGGAQNETVTLVGGNGADVLGSEDATSTASMDGGRGPDACARGKTPSPLRELTLRPAPAHESDQAVRRNCGATSPASSSTWPGSASTGQKISVSKPSTTNPANVSTHQPAGPASDSPAR
jgi:hypothetical protein